MLYLLDGGQIGYQDDTHAYEISSFDRVIDVDQVQSLLFRIHAGDAHPDRFHEAGFLAHGRSDSRRLRPLGKR